jgi:hypothetical protein
MHILVGVSCPRHAAGAERLNADPSNLIRVIPAEGTR